MVVVMVRQPVVTPAAAHLFVRDLGGQSRQEIADPALDLRQFVHRMCNPGHSVKRLRQ